MAISVAPLTTTVMGSVDSERSGIASGINNAVSRAAGLMAIAVFGVLMISSFSRELSARLAELPLSAEVRSALNGQVMRLGGIEISNNLDSATRGALSEAIANSFVSSFRLLMFVSVGLAILSALSSWWLIGRGSSTAKSS